MKLKYKVEIELPDKIDIYPEDGKFEDSDYKPGEVEEYRKQFLQDLKIEIESRFERYVRDGFEEEFLSNVEELSIEGFETLEDYGIKLSFKQVKIKNK